MAGKNKRDLVRIVAKARQDAAGYSRFKVGAAIFTHAGVVIFDRAFRDVPKNSIEKRQ